MSYRIQLHPFARTFDCEEEETLLGAALRQGIRLRYGCKQGGCGRCKAQVLEGEVDHGDTSTFALMSFERNQGFALLCRATPMEDLEIDASDYEEGDLFQGQPIVDYEGEITEISRLSPDITRVDVAVIGPGPILFWPGQYLDALIPHTDQWRSYSMANAPGEGRHLEFLVKSIRGGLATEYLESRLKVGERINFRGPYGQFGLRPSTRKALFVAGGSGLAPLLSILRNLVDRGEHRAVTFFYGARSRNDLILLDELESFRSRIREYEFVAALSDPKPGDGWTGETGLLPDVVCRRFPQMQDLEAYVCGPPAMVDAAVTAFRKRGLRDEDIHFDKFLSKADHASG